jgi:hypothetical protein
VIKSFAIKAIRNFTEERYVFESEWFDEQASLVRKYLLTFFPKDNTIDMVRLKTNSLV